MRVCESVAVARHVQVGVEGGAARDGGRPTVKPLRRTLARGGDTADMRARAG